MGRFADFDDLNGRRLSLFGAGGHLCTSISIFETGWLKVKSIIGPHLGTLFL